MQPASSGATFVPVLQTERVTDLAELHRWIAKRDIPTTPEVEILARRRDQVLGLLGDIQEDDASVRKLDERIDALLPRNARVEIARGLERGEPGHVQSSDHDVGGVRVWIRCEVLVGVE